MKNKKGITLLMLVFLMVIILILASSFTVVTKKSIDNSKLVAFANDLKEIEDVTKTYYLQNNKMPSIDDKIYSQNEIYNFVPSERRNDFIDELKMNLDYSTNPNEKNFYMIDLNKLDVENTKRGLRKSKNGTEILSDVYVVKYPSMNIYYVNGLDIKNTNYFSLTEKVTKNKVLKNSKTQDEGSTTITKTSGITITKDNEWSNKFNFNVEVNIDTSEILSFEVIKGTKHNINLQNGMNRITFSEDFKKIKINDGNYVSSDISQNEIDQFKLLPNNEKKIKFTKIKNNENISTAFVLFDKYDNVSPYKVDNTVFIEKEDANTISFKVKDDLSGVKEVRYEYLKYYDEYGNIKSNFDNVSVYDEDYIKSQGKIAKLAPDGTVEIKLPKEISEIQLRIFDKAGNTSENINEKINNTMFVGLKITDINSISTDLNLTIKSSSKLNNVTLSKSNDGANYVYIEKRKIENNQANQIKFNTDKINNKMKDVYIKIEVDYLETKKYTVIKHLKF